METNADDVSDRLTVYPKAIVTSKDYPAGFAIFKEESNGAVRLLEKVDLSRIASSEPNIAAVDHGSQSVGFESAGQATLQIDVDSDSVSLPITSQDDKSFTFDREISSVLGKAGCNLGACHGNLHGKGGFRLSLRGDDMRFDFDRITAEYAGRRIDLFDPKSSLLLRKATNSIAHQGGQRFALESPEHERILRWIASGAQWSDSPKLQKLEVFPPYVRIAYPHRSSKLIVLATFEDGSVRDVTRWSRIEPSIPMGVTVSPDGIIATERPVDVALNVSYLHGRAAARVAFLGQKTESSTPQFASVNPIDELVLKQLQSLSIKPESAADDSTFLRRIFLAVIGRLPTVKEAREYLSNPEPNKRELLVDRLLSDPGFDLMWAMRWGDLLRNEEKVMSPSGASKFHSWLRDQSAADRPIDEMVSELITSVGSTYDNPPASFHRTHRDPFTAAESSAQVFLGVRIACAKCHNHPFDVWRQDDYYGLSAYFTTIERKQIDNKPKDALDKHIITGDEVISLAEKHPEILHPGISAKVSPAPLPNRSQATDKRELEGNPLQQLAHWVTENNSQFDRNIANRIWYQYFGKGIVDPPDDFRDSNPPSNPELLDFLACELKQQNYSVRGLSRLILVSETFARAACSDSVGMEELSAGSYFAGYPIRRLPAETLLDAIATVTNVPGNFRSGRNRENESEDLPPITRALEMPGVPARPGFLTTFGKPNRLLSCECERTSQLSLSQSLAMLNGVELREKLSQEANAVAELCDRFADNRALLHELYLSSLTRLPSEVEEQSLLTYIEKAENRRQAVEDVMWSAMNSKEFIMIR